MLTRSSRGTPGVLSLLIVLLNDAALSLGISALNASINPKGMIMTTPDADADESPEVPEPVYDAMIRRPESGPDPLVPEPSGTPKTKGK